MTIRETGDRKLAPGPRFPRTANCAVQVVEAGELLAAELELTQRQAVGLLATFVEAREAAQLAAAKRRP